MYSVVLMTAITAGSATPDHWFRGHGCNGCNGNGCYGYMAVNGNFCHGGYGHGGYGYAYGGGYYGGPTFGCYGNHCHGGALPWYAGPAGAGGGWGGGWGGFNGGYNGCYGCTGCYSGHFAGYTHHTGYAGYPGWWGYWPYGCYGCYGAYAGWACYGAPLPGHGHIEEKKGGDIKEKEINDKDKGKGKDGSEEARYENRARVIVDVPEDAKLYIDGQLMKTTSARRVFQTPDLPPYAIYYYELKAEVERDGRTITETRRVLLQPGQVTTASFATMEPAASATASRK